VALLTQLIGSVEVTSGSNTDTDSSRASTGELIAEIGVGIQLVCFGLFSLIALRFNFISKRFATGFEERITASDEIYVLIDGNEKKLKRNWQAILRVTNIRSLCILGRPTPTPPLPAEKEKGSDGLENFGTEQLVNSCGGEKDSYNVSYD